MKKSFKKLGFVSLAASSVLLGSMNATDLETYAALQKPSHVFGNYAEKSNKGSELSSDSLTQQQAQNTASSDSQEATTLENTATTDSQTATTDQTYTKSTDTTVADAAKQVETDNTAVQSADTALQNAVTQVENDAKAKDFDETTFQADQQAEQTAETNLQKAENQLTNDQSALNTALKDQTPSTPPTPPAKKDETSGGTGGEHHTASSGSPPDSSTPPTKEAPPASGGTSGSSVASQLTKDTTMVNGLSKVSVDSMNTTLSGVTQLSQQTATISNLLSGSPNLGNVIPNAQGLSNAFSALESAQNTLKGYLDSSSATIGQLTNGSNAVVGALDKAINQVDMALADLSTADVQKTQAVALVAASDSATTTTDAINFLNALKTNLTAQKDAFMSVHKNIQTAVAQAQATYTPSVINTNNYGQMYGVDAMAGYKWFFGKTKRFGFRSYGYYSYNHANLSFVGSQLGIMEGASQVNNFTYGVGFDALYNFYESKEGYNTAGLFLGFGLGGDSFIVQGESYLKSQMRICNDTAGCSASMNTSYFQMPVEFGFRSNFSKHSGIEVGLKLPLFTNQFYKERGVDGSVDVFYKRNFSIYFNYMINF
ncbi:outer membrane beta-barrel protein [Helicobacter pylori]|uniref:Signal peptide protein, YSIRK family n=1 Tax=Helicobacter pylori HP260AFii TaxID=1159077 RepID=A0ABC9S960_HELPX|nr:outer membrane beta-barrel protein [Helicobacter pylori]EMH19593.1 signal peptide protein, YSIRK family [Helicobacter pylori GAM260ASi]EMH29391.1 signal peptide protein, YSIRK family [Helicobacter pylori GAM268Bii]EMH62874.1 signal peptide protein, YSIRK family [Helicobacter pylori HP260AFi]EMH65964.1 signal peptide protein, YSIRK family [Helicobacter pylori HP260ASii]EMH66196.1 signal peptide protein, YSIRK family [Helicobacter pylori HP260AFii]